MIKFLKDLGDIIWYVLGIYLGGTRIVSVSKHICNDCSYAKEGRYPQSVFCTNPFGVDRNNTPKWCPLIQGERYV